MAKIQFQFRYLRQVRRASGNRSAACLMLLIGRMSFTSPNPRVAGPRVEGMVGVGGSAAI